MPVSRSILPIYAATQGYLVITKAPTLARAVEGLSLIEAGVLNVAGDYECKFPTDGLNVIEVELMCSAVTGTFAPTLRAMRYHQFASSRTAMQDAGGNFVAATGEVLTLADLRGKTTAKVTFTLGAGDSIEFAKGTDPASPTALAEYNGL